MAYESRAYIFFPFCLCLAVCVCVTLFDERSERNVQLSTRWEFDLHTKSMCRYYLMSINIMVFNNPKEQILNAIIDSSKYEFRPIFSCLTIYRIVEQWIVFYQMSLFSFVYHSLIVGYPSILAKCFIWRFIWIELGNRRKFSFSFKLTSALVLICFLARPSDLLLIFSISFFLDLVTSDLNHCCLVFFNLLSIIFAYQNYSFYSTALLLPHQFDFSKRQYLIKCISHYQHEVNHHLDVNTSNFVVMIIYEMFLSQIYLLPHKL